MNAVSGRAPTRSSKKLKEELLRTFDGTPDAAQLASKVYENFCNYRLLAERDRDNMARLVERLDDERVIRVPYLDEDVHDIGGLAELNRYLFVSEEERQEILEGVAV
jgi:hypothetical protein